MMIYLPVSFDTVIQSRERVANTPLFLNAWIAYRHFGEQAGVDGRHRCPDRNVPHEIFRRFQAEEVVEVPMVDFVGVVRSDTQATT